MEKRHDEALSGRLEDTHEQLKQLLGSSTDLVSKELLLGDNTHISLFYIDGLVDTGLLHNSILYSLQGSRVPDMLAGLSPDATVELLRQRILMAGDLTVINKTSQFVHDLMSGSVMLVVDGTANALRIGLPGWEDRAVSEPNSQSVVRGPMEGFTENLRTNTALLRRKIKDSHLWLETIQIGRVTQTSVSLMYLSNIANDELVQEVKRRLNTIDTDSILESGYIEEFIQDTAKTPFPTIYNSDRPDTIAAGILEGKVAILIDGTPFVLLAPTIFVAFFNRLRTITSGLIFQHCCGLSGFLPSFLRCLLRLFTWRLRPITRR